MIVKVGGFDVAVEVRGTGPVCVACPGGPGFDAAYLHDAELERIFTMVYVDPLGTGGSSRLPEGQQYSIARDAETVEAVRVHLDQDTLCILGHSYGGMVAQRYAVDHPERVSRLILYSTTPTTTSDWTQLLMPGVKQFEKRPWFADAMKGAALEEMAITDDELQLSYDLQLPLYVAKWDERYRAPMTRSKLELAVFRNRDTTPFDVRDQLANVRAPTLVLTGKQDFHCGVAPATWIAERIPGAKLVVLDDVGHFAHVEDPAAFIAAIRAFVE